MPQRLKIKIIGADHLFPKDPPDGRSLEEQVNAYCSGLLLGDVLDVIYARGMIGDNPIFTAVVHYRGV